MRATQAQHVTPNEEPGDGEKLLPRAAGDPGAVVLACQPGDRQGADREQAGAAEEHPWPTEPLGDGLCADLPGDPRYEEGGGHGPDGRCAVSGSHRLTQVGQRDRRKAGGHQPLRPASQGQGQK